MSNVSLRNNLLSNPLNLELVNAKDPTQIPFQAIWWKSAIKLVKAFVGEPIQPSNQPPKYPS